MLMRMGSIVASLSSAPADIRFDIARWNGMSHGNVTFVIILCLVRYGSILCEGVTMESIPLRLAWFSGFGRTRFYFGQPKTKKAV